MNVPEQPFSKDTYSLGAFHLRMLRFEEATLIADHLVAMEPWNTLQYSRESLIDHFRKDDSALKRFVVLFEDQVGGVVCVRYPWLLGPYLETLGLFQAFQGLGHGGRIIRWLKDESFPTSRNVWTLVSSFNESAHRFYQASGFEQVAVLTDLVRPGFDELLLRCQKEKS